jgi:arylformamidase
MAATEATMANLRKYRSMSSGVLEREYSPSSMIGGDTSGYLDLYSRRSAKARRDFHCREDIPYGAGSDEVLDFFPARGAGAPLFVFVHGGYWQALSHKDSAPRAGEVLEAGYAFATINYTLAPHGTIEAMVAQVSRALAFLQASAGDLGYDGNRITLSGHSAGAQLAAMQIMQQRPPFDLAAVEHLLLLSGIYDLDPIPLTSINDLLGLDEKRAHALSPMFLSPTAHPRVTVAVAERDTAEFRRQSKEFSLYLGRHGCASSYVLVLERDHFDIILDLGFAI